MAPLLDYTSLTFLVLSSKYSLSRFPISYWTGRVLTQSLTLGVNTEYGCIFGISNPTNDLKAGEDFQVHDKGLMLGVMIGSDEVVYWFLIFACPEILLGLDFPRYSEDDEAAMVKAHSQKLVKDGTVFGDLYRNKRVSHMTPLPHHCFDRWHYKRIMCVGVSAHKVREVTYICKVLTSERVARRTKEMRAEVEQVANHTPLVQPGQRTGRMQRHRVKHRTRGQYPCCVAGQRRQAAIR